VRSAAATCRVRYVYPVPAVSLCRLMVIYPYACGEALGGQLVAACNYLDA
jgi:hypothetical protein